MLYVTLRRRGHFSISAHVASRVGRQLVAGLAMGATLYGVNLLLGPLFDGSTIERMAALTVLVGSGGLVYFGLGWMIGAIDRDDVLILLKRKKPAA
jgi:putative peptidoglycan lipid II flippase